MEKSNNLKNKFKNNEIEKPHAARAYIPLNDNCVSIHLILHFFYHVLFFYLINDMCVHCNVCMTLEINLIRSQSSVRKIDSRTVILVIRGCKKSLSVRFHGMYQITMTIDDLINSILD